LIPRTAGALSAFGGQYSDIVYEASASIYTDTSAFDFDACDGAFASIDQELDGFAATLGSGVRSVRRERFLEARYAHQVWTIELPLGDRAVRDGDDVELVVEQFHDLHERIFAVREPGQRVEVLQCRGRLVAQPFTPRLAADASTSSEARNGRKRRAFFPEHGELEVPVLEGGSLAAGSRHAGPLLITEPTTTVVVPPGVELTTTDMGNYVLELG
jgi:N-methylhydantoinase A